MRPSSLLLLPLLLLAVASEPLLALQAAQGEEAPASWRRWAGAAAGALVVGGMAGFAPDRGEEGFCQSTGCVVGLGAGIGGTLGFLLGSDFDRRALRRHREGPSLSVGLSSAGVGENALALVASQGSLLALTRESVILLDDQLRGVPVPGAEFLRTAALAPSRDRLLLGTSNALLSVAVDIRSVPDTLQRRGVSAVVFLPGGRVVVGEAGRIHLSALVGPTLREEAAVGVEGVPGALLATGDGGALWSVTDRLLISHDPGTLEPRGELRLPAAGRTLATGADGLAVVALGGEGVALVELGNGASPRLVSRLGGMEFGYGAALLGTRGYVAAGSQGVFVFDLSDPAAPRPLGVIRGFGFAAEVVVEWGALHVLDRGRGRVYRLDGG